MAADTVVVLLAEAGEDELHAAAVLDFEEEITHRVRVPIGRGFAGMIAATGKPLAIEELDRADVVNDLLRKRGLNSLLGVPLKLEDEVVGVLHVGSMRPRTFAPREVELLADISERVALAIGRARAHAAERRARERLAFLAEASHLLSASLEHPEALAAVGRAAVPRVADWFVVTLVEDGELLPVCVAHAEPARAERARELLRRRPPRLDAPAGVGKVVRTGEPELVRELTDELLAAEGRDEEHLELLRRLDVASSLIVPVAVGERILGGLMLAAEAGRRFGIDDTRFAEDLARRVAAALENARLHRAERTARARAELLQALTTRLAQARSREEVADVLVREGAAALGAAAGWVALLSPTGDALELLAAFGYPDDVVDRYRAIPVETAPGARAILEEGRASWLASAEDVVREHPRHAEVYERMGFEALAVVPVEAAGDPIGFLALNFGQPQRFPPEERALLLAVAGQCSQALERARLNHELAERANAASVLAHVDDGVFQVDPSGVVRLWNPAAAHLTGIAAGDAVGRPVGELFGGWEAVEDAIDVAARPGAGGTRDAVPLEVCGDERWLAVSGARHPDGTVYAFRDLTSDRGLERARRDFLATASHELRTPLGAVYGAAVTLASRELDEPLRRELLDIVVRECERLTRIVEDLLLAGTLDVGHVRVDVASADAAELAREAADLRRTTLPPGLRLTVEANGGVRVACDRQRLRQVLVNLVDNAIKYSLDGGEVRVEVAAEGARVRFVVSDEGIGIPPAEQERIFEKFYRLDPDLTRGVGGSGLGLYISRELVRRMGGRIRVESEPGRGSRFVVELERAAG